MGTPHSLQQHWGWYQGVVNPKPSISEALSIGDLKNLSPFLMQLCDLWIVTQQEGAALVTVNQFNAINAIEPKYFLYER